MSDPARPDVFTEADLDARVILPYLQSLGIQSHQLRAQRSFQLRLGRNLLDVASGESRHSARLDYLITSPDGHPWCVVELKRPQAAPTDEDRDQGVSYARLLHPMAPLVLVTNGATSRLYDTITKEELTDAAVATLVRGGGQLGDDESLRIRNEALEHFVGYSTANVAAFSRLQRTVRMQSLRGDERTSADDLRGEEATRASRKYEPALYLARSNVRRALEGFLSSSKTVFSVVGPSGSGKTNELCAIAEELGEAHLTLFFQGAELAAPLGQVLADDFDWHFSEASTLAQVCRRLSALAVRTQRPVVIVIDAIDETSLPHFPEALADLAVRLDAFRGQIRLIVSAKPSEWQRFIEFRGNPSPLAARIFSQSTRDHQSQSDGSTEHHAAAILPASVSLDRFTPEEHQQALETYSEFFGLRGPWLPAVREVARDPFMLRIIAEVAAAMGQMPRDPGELSLVQRYLAEKLRRTANADRSEQELVAVASALASQALASAAQRAAQQERGSPDGTSGAPAIPTNEAVSSRARPGRRRRSHRAIADLSVTDEALSPLDAVVSETAVRQAAGLSMTSPVAEELVHFGVLVRARGRGDEPQLRFAYDRVRDYVLATRVFRLPTLAGDAFKVAARTCFLTGPGTEALRWYLPQMNQNQWMDFVAIATERVELLASTYESIRQHVSPVIRRRMDPRGGQEVGAAFSGSPQGHFALGLFRRNGTTLPRALFDPSVGDVFDRSMRASRVPARLMGDRQGREGFWFLADPARAAAAHARAELNRIVKEGALHETHAYLVEERIVALAHHFRQQLGLRRRNRPTVESEGMQLSRFADQILLSEIFPLNLHDLHRSVEIALAVQAYKREHMDQLLEVARREAEAAGQQPRYLTANATWTPEIEQAMRARAVREIESGRRFAVPDGYDRGDGGRDASDLDRLAQALSRAQEWRTTIDRCLLPLPDAPAEEPWRGAHDFEGGYSDAQLALLLTELTSHGIESYQHTMADNFSSAFSELLTHPPIPLGVVCTRHDQSSGRREQFSASVAFGPVEALDAPFASGTSAIAVTLSADGPARMAPRDSSSMTDWTQIVTTGELQFSIRPELHTGLGNVVAPWDAPAYSRNGSESAARHAPARGLLYRFASAAFESLSEEGLLSLAGLVAEWRLPSPAR